MTNKWSNYEEVEVEDGNGKTWRYKVPAEAPDDVVEDDNEVVSKSAFDPENFNEVTLIMLMRLYDLNLALLSAVNPAQAQYLVELHERGQSFTPPPAFMEYE